MNWLDYFIIALLVAGAAAGVKAGLIGSAVMVLAALVGWAVAGRVSDAVSGLFGWPLSNEGVTTVIIYVVLIIAAVLVSRFIVKIIRPVLSIATLGASAAVDRGVGAVLGLVLGLAISGAAILIMARFSFDFNPPTEGVAGRVVRFLPFMEDVRDGTESALTGSEVVPLFVAAVEFLPANALGFVPGDFRSSFDALDRALDRALRFGPSQWATEAAAS